MKLTIEVDFDYEGMDGFNPEEIRDSLQAVLESGAESTCSELRLLHIEPLPEWTPAAPKDKDLSNLPVGTEFYVYNGDWYGKIVESDGEKCVYVHATERTIPIKGRELDLDIRVEGYEVPV